MRITFIGGGTMARAIIAGLFRQEAHHIHVVDPDASKVEQLHREFEISGSASLPAAFDISDILILAVKPQDLPNVCKELKPRINGALLISIAAGIRLSSLYRWLGSERVIRVMPNTPAMIGKGVSGLFASESISEADRHVSNTLMQAIGITLWLNNEQRMDDVTAISGSGPAYVFYFIESMIEAAKTIGFSETDARSLVVATFDGALELTKQSPLPVPILLTNVMSKGGSTQRAIARFEMRGVKQAIIEGTLDSRDRSIEMGEQLCQD